MGPRKESWIKQEDIALCHAWIIVGGDGVKGTDQSSSELWTKVSNEYEATKSDGCQSRSWSSCSSHWKKNSQACMKWRAALNNATLLHRSGENNNDEVITFFLMFIIIFFEYIFNVIIIIIELFCFYIII